MKNRVLITGVSGQDGSFLAKLLITEGYEVYGTTRRKETDFWRLRELGILDKLEIISSEENQISDLIRNLEPNEIYNLAGQSSVANSFNQPFETISSNGLLTLEILECIRNMRKQIKFYQASSSEIFGESGNYSKDEITSIHPRSPYAVSKLFSHWITVNYREDYNLFACCGILFNPESELRGDQFVTRKISKTVAKIKLGKSDCLYIGNMHVKRDWGYAPDYVFGMYKMMQANTAEDYVLATGKLHSLKEFIELSFLAINKKIKWNGSDLDEVGIDCETGQILVKVDPKFFRPTDLSHSLGNPLKANNFLDWHNTKSLAEITSLMVQADINRMITLNSK